MFVLRYILRQELEEEGLPGGDEPSEEPALEGEGSAGDEPTGWLRDLDEETAYNTIRSAQQFPDHLRGLESRLFGRFGPLQEKLNKLEQSLGSRVAFDSSGVKKALDEYDPTGALSEKLVPALTQSLNVNPLDENTLSPFLSPVQESLQQQMGEQLVLSHYDASEIAEMIPEVVDGRFAPTNQRQKDFVDWYSQQGYETQQALLNFGAPYVRALKGFERWEQKKTQERGKTASDKAGRLAGGQQPSSRGRRARAAGPQTPEEAFLAGYNEVE